MHSLDNIEEDNRQDVIDIAEAMQRLLNNDDFKKIFQEIYIDAYAITATQNSWAFDDRSITGVLEINPDIFFLYNYCYSIWLFSIRGKLTYNPCAQGHVWLMNQITCCKFMIGLTQYSYLKPLCSSFRILLNCCQ